MTFRQTSLVPPLPEVGAYVRFFGGITNESVAAKRPQIVDGYGIIQKIFGPIVTIASADYELVLVEHWRCVVEPCGDPIAIMVK